MNAEWLISDAAYLADGHDFDGGGVLVVVGVAVGVVRDEPLGVLGADRHHRGEELHEFPVVGVLLDLQFSEVLMHASITNEIDKKDMEVKPKSVPGPRLRPEEEVEPLGVGLDGGALPGGLVLDEQLLEVEERLPLVALLSHL